MAENRRSRKRSHVTPFSAITPTEKMFATRSRTSSTSNATGIILSCALRIPNVSVPFFVALDVPHDLFMRTLQPDVSTTCWEMRESVLTMWLDAAESMNTVVLPTSNGFTFST